MIALLIVNSMEQGKKFSDFISTTAEAWEHYEQNKEKQK